MHALATLALIGLAAAAPQASTPNINDLPQCAQEAALGAISSTGCALTDVTCICEATSFLQSMQSYISMHCSQSDSEGTVAYFLKMCPQFSSLVPTRGALSSVIATANPSPTTSCTSMVTETVTVGGYQTSTVPSPSIMSSTSIAAANVTTTTAALQFGQSTCSTVGVTLPLDATSSAPAAPTDSSAPSLSGTATSTIPTMDAMPTLTNSSMMPMNTSTTWCPPSSSPTATMSTNASTFTGGADAAIPQAALAALGIVAGLVAML